MSGIEIQDWLIAHRPVIVLVFGVATILVLIARYKVHAFLALILTAFAVSLFVPREETDPIELVTSEFGRKVGQIGIAIAMAAIIGKCMSASGAADRLVDSAVALFGQARAAWALMVSAFVLGIPVFFDTVFYLLLPLARSLHQRTGRNYVRYLLAISAGGCVTHTLVPPTPGPLVVAATLGIPIGVMIGIGLLVAAPTACAGLLYAAWIDPRMPLSPGSGAVARPEPLVDEEKRPALLLALIPVILPVALISAASFTQLASRPGYGGWSPLVLLGNPNVALLLAAGVACGILQATLKLSRLQLAAHVEESLLSAGQIILITAAGGAFGEMLRRADISGWISHSFSLATVNGSGLLVVAWGIAALLKTAQGSSTVAMIVTSGIVASLVGDRPLEFHRAYLATAIGSGSLLISWMNDSGFWIFSRMGGLDESQTLRGWTVTLAVLSLAGLLFTLVFARALPFVH